MIGQPDFDASDPGIGPNRMGTGGAPFTGAGMTLDPVNQRLFVSDPQNNRILVFDVDESRLTNFPDAIAVLGQADFFFREPHRPGAQATLQARDLTLEGDPEIGARAISPGGLGYDWVNHRLFVTQLWENRILVFDVAPERLQNYPEAITVLGQPDFLTFEPRVSQNRFAFPKEPIVDSTKQRLYVSEGFPGGNRVLVFDIEPEHLRSGAAAIDVIGHIDDQGRPDFDRRMANDRLDGGTLSFAGAVAVDSVDHRLWVADQYNHRVLGFQLDRLNRPLEREARWVFGQSDVFSSELARTRNRITMPVAVGYDEVDKRLYVAEGWNDRVLVFDVDPALLSPGGDHEAAVVLGQDDFNSQEPAATRDRFDFAPGPGTGLLTSGFAFDNVNRRVFISDGKNNRVLVFNNDRDRLVNGAGAIGVLGQPDFNANEPRLSADGMNFPGHLAYDPGHERLFVLDSRNERALVFDVAPERFENSVPAQIVIGQPDFDTKLSPQQRQTTSISGAFASEFGEGRTTASQISSALGIAYDSKREQLFITDTSHDRIMVFDAAPERLQNNPTAIAVLGQGSTTSHAPQSLGQYSAQDQMESPKGLAFDNQHGNLYAVDSYWARVLVFGFPESARRVELPTNGLQEYSSLDPVAALTDWVPREGLGLLRSAEEVEGAFMLSATRLELDPATDQQSRVLVSQAAATALPLDSRALVYVERQEAGRNILFLANLQEQATSVDLALSGRNSVRTIRLGSREHRKLAVEDLFEDLPDQTALQVSASAPVSVGAWSEVSNRRGEDVVTMSPIARSGDDSHSSILPNLVVGAGFESEVILLNPYSQELSGRLILHDENGHEIREAEYRIAPEATFRQPVLTQERVASSYYARIQSVNSPLPASAGIIRLVDGGLIGATSIPVQGLRRFATIPIDTRPDLIRQGRRTRVELTIANGNAQGASVRMALTDTEGAQIARYEQLLPAGLQRTFHPLDLLGRGPFTGILHLSIDLPVAISARQITTNLRGDDVLSELPIMNDPRTGSVLPFIDGQGVSTQMLFTSEMGEPIETQVDFFDRDGDAMEIILR